MAPDEPPEDPSFANSIRWQTALGIIVGLAFITDQIYGSANRTCLMEHGGKSLDAYKSHLELSAKVLADCNKAGDFAARFGLPEYGQTLVRGACTYMHHEAQSAFAMYDKADSYYNF